MDDLRGIITETVKVGINEKDVFKPVSDKDVQTRKATAVEMEKVRKQKVLSMKEVCPHCKVDLRTTTVKHEEKEEVVYTLFFDRKNAEWEVDDKDNFGSEHVEFRCGKCGGSLEDGKDFFY
jgi:hypothetical protein